MEEIFISDDIWYEVFAFLSPLEVGLKMALISDRLDVLVDVHFKSREWSLGSIEIRRADDGNGAQIVNVRSDKRLPIPQGPPPGKVIGFERIWIRYVDQTVIEFLQRIRPLFDSSGTNVEIEMNPFEDHFLGWEIIWQNIWPLVNDNICGFHLFYDKSGSIFERLRQFFPAILRNCPNLRSIESAELFPEFPAEDNAGASSAQALAKWLITPRGDGFPKMLRCGYYSGGIDKLKGSFVNASEPVNFIIRLHSPCIIIDPFELKNNLTGERLTLLHLNEVNWLLVRCPIGREADKWETEAIELDFDDHWNSINILFNDWDIGDGMVDD